MCVCGVCEKVRCVRVLFGVDYAMFLFGDVGFVRGGGVRGCWSMCWQGRFMSVCVSIYINV
jgi:hypothetical protein